MHTVLLVHPDVGFHLQKYSSRPFMPSGLLLVGTALHHAGYQVKIIDQSVEKDWKLKFIEALKTNVICVGISSLTGTQILNGLEIAKFVRTTHSSLPIVWGGVHPTLLPEQTLENEFVDIIVRREGEETMLELTNSLKNHKSLAGIQGISYKENGKIVHNPDREFIDLNKQPLPHWELMNLHRYTGEHKGYKSMTMVTSRGCPFNCGYCYVNFFHNRRWRAFNVDNVLKRMTVLINEYGISHFRFDDEEFFINLKRSRDLLEQFKKLNIRWETSVRIDTILRMDDAYLELIKQSGCVNLEIGVESGSNRMLKLMNKKITREDIIKASQKLTKYNLNITFLFMVGFPTETLEEMKESVSLAVHLKKQNEKNKVSFSIFTPYPGCELHNLSIDHGFLPPDCLEKWAVFRFTVDNAAWLSNEIRKVARMIAFTTPFLNERFESYSPLHIKLLGILYRYIARQRIKHFFFHFPLEISLAKWLKLY